MKTCLESLAWQFGSPSFKECWLFLKHTRHSPASGPLHLLFPKSFYLSLCSNVTSLKKTWTSSVPLCIDHVLYYSKAFPMYTLLSWFIYFLPLSTCTKNNSCSLFSSTPAVLEQCLTFSRCSINTFNIWWARLIQVLRNWPPSGYSGHPEGGWGSQPYVLRLKDMADHLVLSFSILGWVRGLHILLGVGARHPSAGHQHDNVANVCDVGNSPQRVIHHRLLEVKGWGRWVAYRTKNLGDGIFFPHPGWGWNPAAVG